MFARCTKAPQLMMRMGLSGIQFVCNHTSDLLITSLITDRIGQHEALLQINPNYYKFEIETRHRFYDFHKKNNNS